MFVYQRLCEEYLYTSVVRRGCVQGPDTKCTDDDRQTTDGRNSVPIARPLVRSAKKQTVHFGVDITGAH